MISLNLSVTATDFCGIIRSEAYCHYMKEFFDYTLAIDPLRAGPDFWSGESDSVTCLELLLNQRVGIERATAATLALHHYFAKPIPALERNVFEVTRWPYTGINLRTPARNVHKMVSRSLIDMRTPDEVVLNNFSSSVIGALASLERYYNRLNRFFDPLYQVELEPEAIRSTTVEQFYQITGLNFPQDNLQKQIASAATILDMKRSYYQPSRAELKKLDRVGDEAADTLLVYIFKQPALIVDQYLRRILYRHFIIDSPNSPQNLIVKAVNPFIKCHEDAHRIHARLNEAAILHCSPQNPNCPDCPFNQFEHRV